MINFCRRLKQRLYPRYTVTCPACGATSNSAALDVAGLWAAFHAHLCVAGVDEDDLTLTRERA